MIKNLSVVSTLLTLIVLLTGADLTAQKKEKPAPKAKPVMCAVVQVGEEFRIIRKEEVAALKKKLGREHKDAVQEHKDAKKAAKKAKQKFTDPAPKAQRLKVVKASIEQDKADAYVEKLKESVRKAEERKERKRAPKKKRKSKK